MAVYKSLYTKIWLDGKFKKLKPDTKLLFIYLGWHPSISITGIYEVDLEVAKLQLKLERDIFECIEELIESGFILFDYDYSHVFVRNHFKYLPKSSPYVFLTQTIDQARHRILFQIQT